MTYVILDDCFQSRIETAVILELKQKIHPVISDIFKIFYSILFLYRVEILQTLTLSGVNK